MLAREPGCFESVAVVMADRAVADSLRLTAPGPSRQCVLAYSVFQPPWEY